MYVGIKHSNEYIEKYFTYGLKKNNKQLSMVPYFLSLAVFFCKIRQSKNREKFTYKFKIY